MIIAVLFEVGSIPALLSGEVEIAETRSLKRKVYPQEGGDAIKRMISEWDFEGKSGAVRSACETCVNLLGPGCCCCGHCHGDGSRGRRVWH